MGKTESRALEDPVDRADKTVDGKGPRLGVLDGRPAQLSPLLGLFLHRVHGHGLRAAGLSLLLLRVARVGIGQELEDDLFGNAVPNAREAHASATSIGMQWGREREREIRAPTCMRCQAMSAAPSFRPWQAPVSATGSS